jgi:hypothetical protein
LTRRLAVKASLLHRLLGILLASSVAACAVRGWTPAEPTANGRPRVHVGDHVRVTNAAGVVELVVTGGADPIVSGRLRASGRPVEVDLRDFERVEVRRVEVWPTLAVNVAGLALLTFATLVGYYFLLSISE